MDKINALCFYETWCLFVSKEIIKKERLSLWMDDLQWTNNTIGIKASDKKYSPFGNFWKGKHPGWEYRKEDALVDLSIYRPEYLNDVMKLSPGGIIKNKPLGEKILNKYPVFYDILVEHENNTTRAFEEMYKLTWYRASLKVLITYNWDEEEDDDYHHVIQTLSENFQKIIHGANIKNPETNTEYLLIVGQKKADNNIIWDKFIYTSPELNIN